MNKYIIHGFLLLTVLFMSCDPVDPLAIYGGSDLVNLVNSGWEDFSNYEYNDALIEFTNAKNQADALNDTSSSAVLIGRTLGEIHTGLGWCNLRISYLTEANENFNISQDIYQYYGFETSLGLMEVKFQSAFQDTLLDNSLISESIEIGQWIFSSGMIDSTDSSPFDSDPNMDVDDVKLLLAKGYYNIGDLSDNVENQAGALFWIKELDSSYDYISEENPNSWNEYEIVGVGGQQFDTFEEVILAVIQILEGLVS